MSHHTCNREGYACLVRFRMKGTRRRPYSNYHWTSRLDIHLFQLNVLARRLATIAAAGLVASLWPSTVSAHVDAVVTPDNVWRTWNVDPFILLPLVVSGALYAAGVRKIWDHGGQGRGVSRWQAASFAAGMLALLIALVSPLDPLGGALFTAHMVQHLVLMLVAAPLLVYASPLAPMMVAMPRSLRSRAGSVMSVRPVRTIFGAVRNPLVVWSLQAVVLWMWHIPSLYDAALSSQRVHAAEHIAFLSTAGLFWWTLIQPHGRRVLGLGTGVIFVFTAGVQSSALGALLTFAPTLWYEGHQPFVAAWNTTALQDQQLAGLLMWVPAGVVYLLAALATFAVWMQSIDPPEVVRAPATRVLDSGAETDRSHSSRSD
ncbi:hypothetical protein BH24CHL1_BH24CHL1_14610 [soil metagenome]